MNANNYSQEQKIFRTKHLKFLTPLFFSVIFFSIVYLETNTLDDHRFVYVVWYTVFMLIPWFIMIGLQTTVTPEKIVMKLYGRRIRNITKESIRSVKLLQKSESAMGPGVAVTYITTKQRLKTHLFSESIFGKECIQYILKTSVK
jgi:hypothetical protein